MTDYNAIRNDFDLEELDELVSTIVVPTTRGETRLEVYKKAGVSVAPYSTEVYEMSIDDIWKRSLNFPSNNGETAEESLRSALHFCRERQLID